MTADISRYSLRPKQAFTAVVRQQGRLPLDADENEASDLQTLALRQTVAETICVAGSPDDGFRATNAAVEDDALDFDITEGSFYLQGVRVATEAMTYRRQPDWLTFLLDAPGSSRPTVGERRDLVYLEAWEQVVTATEDAELYERALNGADTSARQRVMKRVRVFEDVADDCAEALDQMVATRFEGASLDGDRVEVLSQSRLTVGFAEGDVTEDLCKPDAQDGFLGARNEAFRIQLTAPDRLIWGRDNAAPLYRVQVTEHPDDATRRRIEFLNRPRDNFGWPLAGMTVELLRWGSLLDNHEKVAEPTGLLLRVETGYEPSTGSITLTAPVPQAWDDWFTTPEGQDALNPADEPDRQRYFFLRVWTGGGNNGSPDHPFVPGTPVELSGTGLTVTISDPGITGDYWVIAARPNTPTRVTPWALLEAAPPIGPRRLVAPLGLLSWADDSPDKIIDCRHRFRPLCHVGGCCIITVGDGRNSFGDVDSIQEALDRLPPDGGEVCIHPGVYNENVRLTAAKDVTITGCGRFTRWSSEDDGQAPLLWLHDVQRVKVRRLSMTARERDAIVVDGFGSGARPSRGVTVEDVGFSVRDQSAVVAEDVDGLTVRGCTVELQRLEATLSDDPDLGRQAAFFLSGEDILVEQCRITVAEKVVRQRMPAGGIHIGGPSDRVIIRDNVVGGGNGPGIALGSVREIKRVVSSEQRRGKVKKSIAFYVDERGCIINSGKLPRPSTTSSRILVESAGVLHDVRIQRNDIRSTGGSGITSYLFADLGADEFGDAIAVEQIEIDGNRIVGCMQNEVATSTPLLRQLEGWGGIALSVCADGVIVDNLIAGNGEGSKDPICGIFIAVAEDIRIERNRIERNGGRATDDRQLEFGRRDGISIGIAIGGVSTFGATTDFDRPSDRPALAVMGNAVDSPGGRALRAIASGPVLVQGNRLVGAGQTALVNIFTALRTSETNSLLDRKQALAPRVDIDVENYAFLELLADILGGDAVNLVNLGIFEEFGILVALAAGVNNRKSGLDPLPWRGGETLISDNQISLRRHGPRSLFTISAVALVGLDDIGFVDNQAEIESDLLFALTNVLAVGMTVRVSQNRMQKGVISGILSAVTFGVLNQTAFNQSTHCIYAVGFAQGRVVTGNTQLISLLSPQLCKYFSGMAEKRSGRLIFINAEESRHDQGTKQP